MPFWFAFAIAEEFDGGGRGTSISVLQTPYVSFEDAAQNLADAEAPLVAGRVTAAHAYVVEAETIDEAAALVRTALRQPEGSPAVRLVQRDVPTRRVPGEPPEIEALNRLHGELCITHQLAELALSSPASGEHRELLEQHKAILEDLGYTVRDLRGDTRPEGAVAQSGRDRLGYGEYSIAGAEPAAFADALDSLVCELSIARHQAEQAIGILAPNHEQTLRDVSAALDRFGGAVAAIRHQVRAHE